jgi:endonuclease/exonuclease/phosphatase family metal-dependent hydrolase
MRRLLAAALVALLPAMPAAGQAPDTTAAAPLRVMTYNIRFDVPDDGITDSTYAWRERRAPVASTIRFHGADVVGTQEGLLHQVMDLEDRLPGYEWIGVGRRSGGNEFSAIFYRTGRLQLLAHDTYWLSSTPNEPGSKSWGSSLPRIATWARFRDRASGDTLFVVNTHFDHVSAEARRRSARLILESTDGLAGGAPVVVMGDFNATEDSPPYRVLTRTDSAAAGGDAGSALRLRDAFHASEQPHHGPASTYNGFDGRLHEGRRIDHVFVGPRVQVRRHGTLTDRWNGRFPSDHCPVLAEIVLGQ